MLAADSRNNARELPYRSGMAETTTAVLAANLRLLMERRDWNQSELAAKSGVAQNYVSSLLREKQNPTTEILDRLAAAFKIPTWLLLVPGFTAEKVGLLDSPHTVPLLIAQFLSAGPEGRDVISYWAQHEVHHTPEREKIIALRKSQSS